MALSIEGFLSGFSLSAENKRAALAVALIFLVIGGTLLALKGGIRSPYMTYEQQEELNELLDWALSQIDRKDPVGVAQWIFQHAEHPGNDNQPDTHDPLKALQLIKENPDRKVKLWCDMISGLWVLLLQRAGYGIPYYVIIRVTSPEEIAGMEHAVGLVLDPDNRDRFYAFFSLSGEIISWGTTVNGYHATSPNRYDPEKDLIRRLRELKDEGYTVQHVTPPSGGWYPITWFTVATPPGGGGLVNESEQAGAKIRVEAQETDSGWDVTVTLTAPSSSCKSGAYDFWVDGNVTDYKPDGVELCNGETETFTYSIPEGDHVVGAAWGCGLYATLALVGGTGGTSAEGTPGYGGYSSSTGGESGGEGGIGYTPPVTPSQQMYLGPWLIRVNVYDARKKGGESWNFYDMGNDTYYRQYIANVELTAYNGRDAVRVWTRGGTSSSDYVPMAWVAVKPDLLSETPIDTSPVYTVELEYEVTGGYPIVSLTNGEWIYWFKSYCVTSPCGDSVTRPSLFTLLTLEESGVRRTYAIGPAGSVFIASSTYRYASDYAHAALLALIDKIESGHIMVPPHDYQQISLPNGRHRLRITIDKDRNILYVFIDGKPYMYTYTPISNPRTAFTPEEFKYIVIGQLDPVKLPSDTEVYLYLDSLRIYDGKSPDEDYSAFQPTSLACWTDRPTYEVNSSHPYADVRVTVHASPPTDAVAAYLDTSGNFLSLKPKENGAIWEGTVRVYQTGEHTVVAKSYNVTASCTFQVVGSGSNVTTGEAQLVLRPSNPVINPGDEETIAAYVQNVDPEDVKSVSLTVQGPTGTFSLSPDISDRGTYIFRFGETWENGTYKVHGTAVVHRLLLGDKTLEADAEFCVGECSTGLGGVLGDLGGLTEPNQAVYDWLVSHGVPEGLAKVLATPLAWLVMGLLFFLLIAGGGTRRVKIEAKFSYMRGAFWAVGPPSFYFSRFGAGRGLIGPPIAPRGGVI